MRTTTKTIVSLAVTAILSIGGIGIANSTPSDNHNPTQSSVLTIENPVIIEDGEDSNPSSVTQISDSLVRVTYKVPIPDGMRASVDANGALTMVTSDGSSIAVGIPEIVDKNGKILSTKYRMEGQQLVQEIDIEKGNSFSVSSRADIRCEGLSLCSIVFSRSETKTVASGKWSTILGTCALGGPPMIAACAISGAWVIATANTANNQGKCLAIRQFTGPYVRNCIYQ